MWTPSGITGGALSSNAVLLNQSIRLKRLRRRVDLGKPHARSLGDIEQAGASIGGVEHPQHRPLVRAGGGWVPADRVIEAMVAKPGFTLRTQVHVGSVLLEDFENGVVFLKGVPERLPSHADQ